MVFAYDLLYHQQRCHEHSTPEVVLLILSNRTNYVVLLTSNESTAVTLISEVKHQLSCFHQSSSSSHPSTPWSTPLAACPTPQASRDISCWCAGEAGFMKRMATGLADGSSRGSSECPTWPELVGLS